MPESIWTPRLPSLENRMRVSFLIVHDLKCRLYGLYMVSRGMSGRRRRCAAAPYMPSPVRAAVGDRGRVEILAEGRRGGESLLQQISYFFRFVPSLMLDFSFMFCQVQTYNIIQRVYKIAR